MLNKKAMGSVIATALLLVVSVISVVGFQNWFNSYSSSMFSDIEIEANSAISNTKVEGLVGSNLYFKNGGNDNVTIISIKINDVDCNISGSFASGLQTIPLQNNCTKDLTTEVPEVVVITDKGILSKYVYFKENILSTTYSSCTLDSILINHGENYTFYNSSYVSFGNSCSSLVRVCNDGTYEGNVSYNYSSCSVNGQDTMPDAFSFTDLTDVALNSVINSNTIVPTGFDGSLNVGITGDGNPQLSINGGSWSTSSSMNLGDKLDIRLTSSALGVTSSLANLTLGNYSTIWNVTTSNIIQVLIVSDVANFNLFDNLSNPMTSVNVEVIINNGITVYSTNTSIAAFSTGNIPEGSNITIINNGNIIGKGGDGGDAPSDIATTWTAIAGHSGEDGGNAVDINLDLIINNSNGNIYSGGGGGGGGASVTGMLQTIYGGGGGGGGGASYDESSGGSGGDISGNVYLAGNPGLNGNITSPGLGGTGYYGDGTFYGGDGGDGGNFGEDGNNGNPGVSSVTASGGVGGAAGKAIELNGNIVIWLGGNNSAQVKGIVS